MDKEKDLVFFTNEQVLNYAFNGCICYINDGYLSFASVDNPQLPNRETVFEDISFEYYVENKQITHSSYANLVKNKRKRDKQEFRNDLAWRYGRGDLKFHDSEARKRILDFIGKGKVI